MERADARLPLRAVRPRLLAELRACARNRSFLAVTGVLLFSWLGLLSVQNNLLLYVRYAADVEDAVTTILVVFQLSAIAFLVGAGAAVAYLIPWSMLPDVVAEDELQTGVRREGTHYGVFVLVQQAGLSLGLAGSNLALEAAGYVNPGLAGGSPSSRRRRHHPPRW